MLIHKYNKDAHSFAKSISNAISIGDPFKAYVAIVEELPTGKYLSTGDYILEYIGIETSYQYLYDLLHLPHSILQQRLKKLESLGYIEVEIPLILRVSK